MSDNDDLIKALEAMGRFEHDDLSLGTEAAEALTSLQQKVYRLEAYGDNNLGKFLACSERYGVLLEESNELRDERDNLKDALLIVIRKLKGADDGR